MPGIERTVTVKITDEANAALRESARREHVSDADIINCALSVYNMISRHRMVYGDVILRHRDGTAEELVIE